VIKSLSTGGKGRGGWKIPEVRQSCSLREIVGILPKSDGNRRSGKVIPESEQVATDSKALRSTADQTNCQKSCTNNTTLKFIYERSSPNIKKIQRRSSSGVANW